MTTALLFTVPFDDRALIIRHVASLDRANAHYRCWERLGARDFQIQQTEKPGHPKHRRGFPCACSRSSLEGNRSRSRFHDDDKCCWSWWSIVSIVTRPRIDLRSKRIEQCRLGWLIGHREHKSCSSAAVRAEIPRARNYSIAAMH